MPERYLGRLQPGMDVCDITGQKVGTIARVYRYADAVVATAAGSAAESRQPPYDEVIEVKTGLFGLGAHLYIPLSAIQEVLSDSVFVSKPREEFERLGWYERPAYLDELQ